MSFLLYIFSAPPDVRIGSEDNFRYYSPQSSSSFTTMKRKRSSKNVVRNFPYISHFNDSAWVRGLNPGGTVLILSYFQMWKVYFFFKKS